jgi:hypothetical protein
MGLTRAGAGVLSVFGIADGVNKTSAYARRINFGAAADVAAAQ